MKIYTKEEIKQEFGNSENVTLLRRGCYVSGYLSGINVFESDELKEKRRKLKKSTFVVLQKHNNGLVFELYFASSSFRFESSYKTGIKIEQVNYCVIQPQEQLIKHQNNAVGGAIIGGLLLGPLGAVVGGLSSMNDTQKLSNIPDNILTISIQLEENEHFILFEVRNVDYPDVEKFFLKYLPEKYKKFNEIEKTIPSQNTISIADELKKLKELLDTGILTQEEFDQQKKKLLNQ